MYAPQRYAKVRISPGTFRLVEVTGSRGDFLVGRRVTPDGERWAQETATHITEELVIFRPSNIVQELRLSLHYGTLEKV